MEPNAMKEKLGTVMRDQVTGIVGKATAFAYYQYGDPAFRLEWMHDGEAKDDWLNIDRLVEVES